MKKFSILKVNLIAVVLTLASTSALHAQALDAQALIKVPFSFEVGPNHFAPGVYTVGLLNGSTLYVRGRGQGAFASIHSDDNGKMIAGNKVVFERIGSQYFLSQVWSAGTQEHLVAYPSKAEKQALRELAANHTEIQNTEVILAQATN